MKIEQTLIYPVRVTNECAIDVARAYYEKHSDLSFDEDMADYMRNGFVTSYPWVFGMVKVINHEGEPAWFIRMAVGPLIDLLRILPFPLPKIAFCRNNEKDSL